VAALRLGAGELAVGAGAHGLATMTDATGFLHALAERGVRAATFEGTAVAA
jgi:hypothetical protein